MQFDADTYYKTMNDPASNLDFGCVFSFKRSESARSMWAVDLRVVEWDVPVIFSRTGASITDFTSEILNITSIETTFEVSSAITTTATRNITEVSENTTSSGAAKFYFQLIFAANVVIYVAF